MTEEVQNTPEPTGETTPQEYTPVEQEALSQGWVPKEQYNGEQHKWVDAGEFIRRGELFKKIDSQKQETKELRKALDNFKELFTKVKETEYNRALANLKQEIKLANREQDFDKADALEAEMERIETEATLVKQRAAEVLQSNEKAVHPEFAAWQAKNEWYVSQPHMKAFADTVGAQFAAAGMSPVEVLKKVEAEVKKEFPNRFINPNQSRPSLTEGASRQAAKTDNDGFKLSEQEEKVMNNLVKSGVMTKKEYIESIKAIRGPKEK